MLGIATQGLGLVDEWTIKYKISFFSFMNTTLLSSKIVDSTNKSFVFYQENNSVKV